MHHLLAMARSRPLVIAAALILMGLYVLIFQPLSNHTQALEPSASAQALSVEPSAPDLPELEAAPATTATPQPPASVIVYVSGAVRAPDVYQLPAAARVKDVVLAAGGMTEESDPDRINLADRLSDGQHVYVPRLGEAAPPTSAPDQAPASASSKGLINLNTASADDLDQLPGIGQAFAERIIEYRTANGPFKAIEDLRQVKGIGPTLFEELAPLVTVGP